MGKGTGCPILAKAMFEDVIPAEWLEQEPWEEHYPSDAYHCIEFRPKGWRDPKPRPKPAPQPGPGLFEEPPRGPRMLKPVEPVSQEAVSV